MNALVLVLSYIVLLLIVAVGYLLWKVRNQHYKIKGLDNVTDMLQDQVRRIDQNRNRYNRVYEQPVPWSAFENFQEAINERVNALKSKVDDLEGKYQKTYVTYESRLLHTNPEDSHATE